MRKRIVFETPWFGIEELLDESPGAVDPRPYYSIARNDGVICLVLTPEGDIVLARQFRPPLQRQTLEMPAGGIESGESPEDAVAREVQEETGYCCETFVRIAACRLMLNREGAVEYFFCALGARRHADFVARERVEVEVLERAEFRKLIREDVFEQTVALGGLWLAEEKFGFRLFEDSIEKITAKLRAGIR
jgi:8-oxo-dGTP pyrophosphatase MutT (NUDIX family)